MLLRLWMDNRERFNESFDQFFMGIVNSIASYFVFVGEITLFFIRSIKLAFQPPSRLNEIIRHMEFIGNKSLLIIALSGCFTGLALTFQIYLGFKLVNATGLVGSTVALGITRELAPVLTGLIVAARAGGAMAARLGTMRVGEQIDALEVMGINPIQYLVAPRIVAAFITMPLLCGVFDFVAMAGARFLSVSVLDLDAGVFWDRIVLWIEPRDINEGLLKSAIFGLVFATICTYRGFYTKGGAKGVGEATNQGVVSSMVLIIILDYFVTNLLRFYYQLAGIGR